MDYNIHKVCRICLEEGALTSIFSTEFAMMPSTMIMMCAKIRVYKSDNLPAVICNNCIYRLGVAYHFKQECENSDVRLRQYLGLADRGYGFCDAQTNTDETLHRNTVKSNRFSIEPDDTDSEEQSVNVVTKKRRRSRYQRKPPDQYKKRGPKPLDKLPQTCYECQKIFKCAAQLQMHMRTHTGEKPFGCTYCSRRFAQKYNLRIHERTHTGERPFQCEICSKQFSALGNFQAHQKIHTGIKDQLCPVCQKAFYSSGDLSKHMSTHTGLKQHECEICGKGFSRQRDMRAHKRKLHNNATHEEVDDDDVTDDDIAVQVGGVLNVSDCFKCPDCNKEFPTANSLSVHFRSHASGNILNLPQPQGPPPTPQHHHHPYSVAPMHAHGIHESLHTHHHAQQHAHPHHLSTLNSGSLQTANVGAIQHHHHHAAMTHMLPPPPTHLGAPPPPPPTPTGIMHSQRLHPY